MRNMTEINIVLDRSGSMNACWDATIESINAFTDGQRNGPDEAVISLHQFDTVYETVYESVPVANVPRRHRGNYLPRGGTALLDAMGRTITTVGQRLSNTPEYLRPNKVIVVIITDGMENSSQEYMDLSKIREMVKHQEDKYNWTFIYLGANQNSYHEAAQYGFSHGNTLNYAATRAGMTKGVETLTAGVAICRASPGLEAMKTCFTPAQQAEGDAMVGQSNTGYVAPGTPNINVSHAKTAEQPTIFERLKQFIDSQPQNETMKVRDIKKPKKMKTSVVKK